MSIYRHGDVVVEQVDVQPTGVALRRSEGGHVVLAEGELTGHAHRIKAKNAELYPMPGSDNDNAVRLLVVLPGRPVALTHEEHKTIRLPPGSYRVRIKRQYNPEGGWSPVAD